MSLLPRPGDSSDPNPEARIALGLLERGSPRFVDEHLVTLDGDRETVERPGRGSVQHDALGGKAAAVAWALENAVFGRPPRSAPQMSATRLEHEEPTVSVDDPESVALQPPGRDDRRPEIPDRPDIDDARRRAVPRRLEEPEQAGHGQDEKNAQTSPAEALEKTSPGEPFALVLSVQNRFGCLHGLHLNACDGHDAMQSPQR